MEKYNRTLGNFGEDIATDFLRKSGYKILDRNFNCRFGEIDIIAFDCDCLVFIEVKTRSGKKYGAPHYAVNYWKQSHLNLSAKSYIAKKRLNNYCARFDVVEVFAKCADNNFMVSEINIIKNAF